MSIVPDSNDWTWVLHSACPACGPQGDRPGRRSDGARFTVESFGRYFIHDPVYHMYDVTGRRSGKDG